MGALLCILGHAVIIMVDTLQKIIHEMRTFLYSGSIQVQHKYYLPELQCTETVVRANLTQQTIQMLVVSTVDAAMKKQ